MQTQNLNLQIPSHLMSYINKMAREEHQSLADSALALLEESVRERLEDEVLLKMAEDREADMDVSQLVSHEDAWK